MGENISPQTAHEITGKFAEQNYPSYEVLISTHSDAPHIHFYIIINSVSFGHGRKLHQPTDTILKLRFSSDKILNYAKRLDGSANNDDEQEQGFTKTMMWGGHNASIKKLDERKFKITVSNGYNSNGKKIAKAKTIEVPKSVQARGVMQYVKWIPQIVWENLNTYWAN